MRLLLFSAALAAVALSQRPKVKDASGRPLIDMADVGESCADSYTGYAIIDGSLERCDNLTAIQAGGQGQKEYEEYKCRRLRVHGWMRNGKCVCKERYKGPICNEYKGCPSDKPSLLNSVCSKNGCAHDGTNAIGSAQMECICKDQWDGRHCNRLACWRLTNRGTGENCATLKSCEKNGKFENGVCMCSEGYGGDTCGQKCPAGEITCSTSSLFPLFSTLLALPILVDNLFYVLIIIIYVGKRSTMYTTQ